MSASHQVWSLGCSDIEAAKSHLEAPNTAFPGSQGTRMDSSSYGQLPMWRSLLEVGYMIVLP
jgi:hypothetical protein